MYLCMYDGCTGKSESYTLKTIYSIERLGRKNCVPGSYPVSSPGNSLISRNVRESKMYFLRKFHVLS